MNPEKTVNGAWLDQVRCPRTGTKLRFEQTDDGDSLVSEGGFRYPIRDGLPVLLPEAGVPVGGAAGVGNQARKSGLKNAPESDATSDPSSA